MLNSKEKDQALKHLTILVAVFIVTRLFIVSVYAYGFHLYCGDSAYYLGLADRLDRAAEDRPSGYPFFLALFQPDQVPTHLRWVTPVQMGLSLISVLVFFIVVYSTTREANRAFVASLFLMLFPHTGFMETSIMPDSLSNSLVTLVLALLLLDRYSVPTLFGAGLFLGYLPLLRSNHLVFTMFLGLAFVLNILLSANKLSKKAICSLALVAPCLSLLLWYSNDFAYTRLGVKGLSHFGGRILFANIAQGFTCSDLEKSFSPNEQFSAAVKGVCTEKMLDRNNSIDWLLWQDEGLIKSIDRQVKLNRTQGNAVYKRAALNLLREKPLLPAKIISRNFFRSFAFPSRAFYQNNFAPSLGAGCDDALHKYLHYEPDLFIQTASKNLESAAVRAFSSFSSTVRSATIVLTFLVLFLPLFVLFQYRRGRRHGVRDLVLLACLYCAVSGYFVMTVFLTYTSPRHFQAVFPIIVTIGFLLMGNRTDNRIGPYANGQGSPTRNK